MKVMDVPPGKDGILLSALGDWTAAGAGPFKARKDSTLMRARVIVGPGMQRSATTIYVLIACAAGPAIAGPIVINEVHYAPRDKTVPEEFVEVHNVGGVAVDVSGWYFAGGIQWTFANGTSVAPGGFLVVAQDPAAIRSVYGPAVPAVGPFAGRLSNEGDHLVLRNRTGGLEDEVDYRMGFPWPTPGGPQGYSMELVHPDLDNDLGGSWRTSNPGIDQSSDVVRAGETWRYLKGVAEASSPPAGWRQAGFAEAGWSSGQTPIGYGEGFIRTQLPDMQGGYSSVYLRKTFQVDDPTQVAGLVLDVQYDDGFNAWVNGVHVAGDNVPSQEMAYDGTATTALEDLEFNAFNLPHPSGYLVRGTNVLAIQLHNASLGGSSDAFIDARLRTSLGAGAGPTPGAPNSVLAANAPPQLRQVAHFPESPRSGEPVLLTVKATDPDGVAAVSLEVQLVEPGAYVQLDEPAYEAGWTSVPMFDDGTEGDPVPGDGTFSARLPGSIQVHRRLVRYRITASDAASLSIRAPYADDPQPNFAYFVYDGVPAWSGAIQPGSADPDRGAVWNYSPGLMGKLPVFHLITKKASTEDSTWFSRYGGDNYLWLGTLVHGGKVYDHIRYRARGGVWRYAMGKNMWKFDFLKGHGFEASDDHGRKYQTAWDKLNFSAVIQQGDYLHRGEQGLFEAAAFKLFNLAGVPAPKTSFSTFRIIDEATESGSTQYGGDFWGLYLVIEQMDGRFLDEHGLPDGNLYKMEGGTGELNNQGPTGATDKSDLNAFLAAYEGTTPSDDWWRQNLDLETYYGYRAIVEAVHHYDIGYGKNYFYYLDPEHARWVALPWDLDLTWADNMFGDGNEPFKSRVLSRAAFGLEYRNRMREVRDLLYNTDQAWKLIDELAAIIRDPAGGQSIVDADRAMWDYNPIMANSSIINPSKAGQGRFYQVAATKDFAGMVTLMKNYVVSRGQWIDANVANDAAIPRKPTVTSTGPPGFPIDGLTFRSSAFSDPQGDGTFGGMKWRLAEITPAGAPAFDPAEPRLHEVHAAWESPELAAFAADITIPSSAVKIGSRYRVRVRMKDATGRWSNWSNPAEFTAGPPSTPFPQQTHLRVTEVMYHPAGGLGHEFIEVQNAGPDSLDLRAVSLGGGIEFRFAGSEIEELGPGEYAVVVEDRRVFDLAYGAGLPVAGEYSGRLENAGEQILLVHGGNATILDFTYFDDWYPLTDGAGPSLVVADPLQPLEAWGTQAGWQESAADGGSPGGPDGGGPPAGGLQRPGDSNQDGTLDLSDGISFLLRLFGGGGGPLPCDGASINEGGNALVFDLNGDARADLSDAIFILNYLFRGGASPALGTGCVRLAGCPHACGS
jgi:hypothetical protein